MSELTSEAIFAELAKLRDSKNRVISFADGQTIVPNSLLEEVWREAERNVEARIIKLLREKAIDLKRIAESIDEDEYANAGDGDYPYWGSFALDDFADALIKGENK